MADTITPKLSIDRQAVAATCRAYHVESLDLFGSAVTDRFDPDRSDVDLVAHFNNSKALAACRT